MTEKTKPTILAVDDESPILRMFSRCLGNECNILTAETLEEALETIDKRRQEIQLLITDIGLTSSEGMEGLNVLLAAERVDIEHRFGMSGRKMNTDEKGDVNLETNNDLDLEFQIIQAGAQKIFQKPNHMMAMMRQIRETLGLPEKKCPSDSKS
ncbi:hypothetical protein JW758_04625 [Candidatus Peregrinibacteria bacterium]|nr:hypothetical protein [Candidatus Peregrinibacteria bacterium]